MTTQSIIQIGDDLLQYIQESTNVKLIYLKEQSRNHQNNKILSAKYEYDHQRIKEEFKFIKERVEKIISELIIERRTTEQRLSIICEIEEIDNESESTAETTVMQTGAARASTKIPDLTLTDLA